MLILEIVWHLGDQYNFYSQKTSQSYITIPTKVHIDN